MNTNVIYIFSSETLIKIIAISSGIGLALMYIVAYIRIRRKSRKKEPHNNNIYVGTPMGFSKAGRAFSEDVFNPKFVPPYVKEVKGTRGEDGIMVYTYTDNYGVERNEK